MNKNNKKIKNKKLLFVLFRMLNFIVYLVYYDLYYYFAHRLLHSRVLYPIHKYHHNKSLSHYSDFYKIHVLEIPFTSAGLLMAIYFHKLYINQLLLCILFINIRGMICHDHKCVNIVGDHHLLHHKYYKCNYGEYWIDYIFNTVH